MVAERRQPCIELAGQGVHLGRVTGQFLLSPRERHRAQQRDQCGRSGEHGVAAEGVLHQRRVVAQGGVEERVGRDEEHHEIGRGLERGPVLLGGQGIDVRAQVAGVLVEEALPGALVPGLQSREVRLQWRLRVHHHGASAVQLDDQIRPYAGIVRFRRDLLSEVTVFQQPGRLDDAPELVLTPTATGLRRTQGGDQLLRLGAQLARDNAHVAHLFAQLGVGVDALPLQLSDPFLVAAQHLVQRRDSSGDRLLGLGGGLVRERAHRLLEAFLPVGADLHGRLKTRDVGGRPEPRGQPAEGRADHEADKHYKQRRNSHIPEVARRPAGESRGYR